MSYKFRMNSWTGFLEEGKTFDADRRTPIEIGLQIFRLDECGKSNALCYGPYTGQDVCNIHSGAIFEAKLKFVLLLFW